MSANPQTAQQLSKTGIVAAICKGSALPESEARSHFAVPCSASSQSQTVLGNKVALYQAAPASARLVVT